MKDGKTKLSVEALEDMVVTTSDIHSLDTVHMCLDGREPDIEVTDTAIIKTLLDGLVGREIANTYVVTRCNDECGDKETFGIVVKCGSSYQDFWFDNSKGGLVLKVTTVTEEDMINELGYIARRNND